MLRFNRDYIDKFIFISDIHLGCKNASIEWSDNIVNYFKNFFIPLLKTNLNDGKNIAVVIAGDFFDNRQNIDINIMNIGANIMEEISNICEVFIIIGNHDIYKKSDIDVSSTRIFKYFNNVHVIDDVAEISYVNNSKMIFIPWIGDHKKETEIISKHSDSNFIIMHTSISGMTMDNGREILDGANPTVFKDGIILSGHIHKRQETKKVIYFGSPYQMRRSDIGNDKGIYILNASSNSLTYVQNTYSPRFLRINLLDILDKSFNDIKSLVYNNYVDIIVKKRLMNDIDVSKLLEIMDQCQVKKIEIILDKDVNNIINDNNIIINKDTTIKDVFINRLNNYGLSDDDIQYLNNLNDAYLKLANDGLKSDLV